MQSEISFSRRELFSFTPPLSLDQNPSPDAYLKKKISLSLINLAITLAYLGGLAFTHFKDPFIKVAWLAHNSYVQFLIFIVLAELVLSGVRFSFDFYADYVIEHRFNLSNQTFMQWVFRKLKGTLIGGIIGIVLLLVFYFLLMNFHRMWWLLFAAFFFIFQVLTAQLFPTLILPMFYKLKPISDEGLRSRLSALVEKFGYKMSGVFSFDLSRETRKANAALTGLGKSRKIIISDTLLKNFTNEEIEVVLAHELGHLVKHHMIKGIILSAIISLAGFFIMAQIYLSYRLWYHLAAYDLFAIPFLAFMLAVFGVLVMPLGNFFSRKIEHEADMFALDTTGMRREFAESMRKLGELNLTPENPPAWIEKIFFSHPSIGARIKAALPDGLGEAA